MKRGLLVLFLLAQTHCGRLALVGVVEDDAGARDANQAGSNGDNDSGILQPTTFIDECKSGNPAQLDLAGANATLDASHPDPAQRLLYPYDGTVFPGGMTAPLLMWSGPAADAVLVRARGGDVEYVGCLAPSGEQQLAFPQAAWERFGAARAGTKTEIEVQLTTLKGGTPTGPMTVKLVLAGARFVGSVYYMKYVDVSLGAAVERARPGQAAQVLHEGRGCTACHTVSANGTRLLGYTQGFSVAFNIDRNTTSNPNPQPLPLPGGELAGLYPDGSLYVAPAHPPGVGPRTYFGAPQVNAGLYDITTGASFPNAGIPTGAMTPAFSPTGALLAFNDFALDGGRGLAVMDFAAATTTASNYRVLFQDAQAYPAWPNFLPNDQAVVFARGDSADFSGAGARIGGKVDPGPKSDIYLMQLGASAPQLLARAMGFAVPSEADADTYLPFGSEDLHQNYYPSVFPVLSAGYYWVFFDSIRNYGNQGVVRQVWGAAIDASWDAASTEDPSHPAFYLPGQDIAYPNLRPVAAIDPCQADAASCSTGSECCSGRCSAGLCEPFVPIECAVLGALCTADADCCDRTQQCLQGYCRVMPND